MKIQQLERRVRLFYKLVRYILKSTLEVVSDFTLVYLAVRGLLSLIRWHVG
jgi:hypothetical protein